MLEVSIGTMIWSSIAFLLVVFILAKTAWKPILGMIKAREDLIEKSLTDAKEAEERLKALKKDNEKLMAEARQEREGIIKEAKEMKSKMLEIAKAEAKEEGSKIIAAAESAIRAERAKAVSELRSLVGELSIDIAEKILKEELSSTEKQKELIASAMKDAKLN